MEYSGPAGEPGPLHCLATRLEQGVLTIALNRPAQQNRLDVALSLEMQRLLRTVAADPDVRVVLLRGAGEAFCAGRDAEDFADAARHGEAALRAARAADEAWRTRLLRLLPQPVIAVVHGLCTGEACAVLESCDIVLAAHEAQFALPQEDTAVTTGVVAKAAARVIAPRAARYYALTGRRFDGREAERNGLATRSVPAASLDAEAQALAADLAAKDATAMQFTKETLLHVDAMSWDGVLSFTAAKFAELKALQAGRPSARAAAVESFLAGKSKPGLGS
jgi:trans-feruloyl-CoA hydratase/vanillin synthase